MIVVINQLIMLLFYQNKFNVLFPKRIIILYIVIMYYYSLLHYYNIIKLLAVLRYY